MNFGLLRTITPDEVETYHRDGVLLLSGMFDKDWIELLNKGLDTNFKTADATQNKAEAVAKSATDLFRSSEKLKDEFENVEQELHEMNKKEEN